MVDQSDSWRRVLANHIYACYRSNILEIAIFEAQLTKVNNKQGAKSRLLKLT